MHRPDPQHDDGGQFHTAPLNPLPWVVWALALPIIAFEAAFGLGQAGLAGGASAVGWRLAAIQHFAFVPDILRAMWQAQTFPLSELARIVTYPFVHGSFTHAAMVLVFILALGKMVGEIFRPLAVLAVFFGAAVTGALVYTVAADGACATLRRLPGGLRVGRRVHLHPLGAAWGAECQPGAGLFADRVLAVHPTGVRADLRHRLGLGGRAGWLCHRLRAVVRGRPRWPGAGAGAVSPLLAVAP